MDFEKVKNSYRKNALVQKEMAFNLISILEKSKGVIFDKVFEIGAGTGFLTDNIKKYLKLNKLVLNDITENFTNINPDYYIKGDITKIDIPFQFDLILSNAVFQWIEDYNLLFKKLSSHLEKNGVICFSSFGRENFKQIKDITGIGLNYPCLDEFIIKNGFEILYFEEGLQTIYFKNVKDVLLHIKFTGVKTGNGSWTKTDYKNFETAYLKKYKDDMGFELTYHPVYYLIQKRII